MEDPYRPAIRAFILASQTILSPILLTTPLTPEEKKLVRFYANSLIEHCKE